MAQKARDFYGKEVTAVIEEACREFGVSQEELDIEVLETGSAGIFGLCKKKAHIRARLKQERTRAGAERDGTVTADARRGKASRDERKDDQSQASGPVEAAVKQPAVEKKKRSPAPEESKPAPEKTSAGHKASRPKVEGDGCQESAPVEPPRQEVLDGIRADIVQFVELMGYTATVELEVKESTLLCRLQSEHEEALIGQDGRTLDSLQYLLRKMESRILPERMMLSLDVGDFRQRRAEELKSRALELAAEVRETGKTQAIPALNPAERRVVHMVLQEDKEIRSRSVGDGLFKKVLIYRPGKGQKSQGRKRKGRSGGRAQAN